MPWPKRTYFATSMPRRQPRGELVDGRAAGDAAIDTHGIVVMQVGADAGKVDTDGNAELLEVLRRADAGKLEHLRRVDGATAEDHLTPGLGADRLAGLGVRQPGDTVAFDRETGHEGVRLDPQVRPLHGGPQEGACRAGAETAGARLLIVADAILGRAIVVGVVRQSQLLARLDEVVRHGVMGCVIGDDHRATAAPVGGVAREIGLRLLEVRQDVLEAPAAAAHGGPIVEVLALAAHLQQAIDGSRTAEHLAAWKEQLSPERLLLRLRVIDPVHLGIVEDEKEAGGKAQINAAVHWTGFQDENAIASALAEPCRQHRPGRARADDDEIVLVRTRCRHLVSSPMPDLECPDMTITGRSACW